MIHTFRTARSLAIEGLLRDDFSHAERKDREIKNLLTSSTRPVSPADVVAMLKACRGNQHSSRPLRGVSNLPLHEFKPIWNGVPWYIKLYFLPAEGVENLEKLRSPGPADVLLFFVSVHP